MIKQIKINRQYIFKNNVGTVTEIKNGKVIFEVMYGKKYLPIKTFMTEMSTRILKVDENEKKLYQLPPIEHPYHTED